jgi:hypothetical protein
MQTAYVGNFVHHVPFGIDGNNPVYAPGASTSQTSINGRRSYDPGVLGDLTYIQSGQTANYNSLQVSAHKHGLMLNGFYVWSLSMWSANASAIGQGTAQNFSVLSEERCFSDNDRRNVANISGIWTLNYYQGRKGWEKQLANGWKISAIAFLQSGVPFTITTGSDKNLDGYSNDRSNLVPGVNPFLSPHRPRTVSSQAWFNTAAFIANGPGVAGGIGPGGADGNTPRDFLRAPGYRDVDLGLERDFRIREGMAFAFRADMTNVFNLVSLNAPTATLSSSIDGHITGAAPNRIIQLGGRFPSSAAIRMWERWSSGCRSHRLTLIGRSSLRLRLLLTSIQMVPVENRVEPQGVGALRLPTPEWPKRKHHHVSLANWLIKRERTIG